MDAGDREVLRNPLLFRNSTRFTILILVVVAMRNYIFVLKIETIFSILERRPGRNMIMLLRCKEQIVCFYQEQNTTSLSAHSTIMQSEQDPNVTLKKNYGAHQLVIFCSTRPC